MLTKTNIFDLILDNKDKDKNCIKINGENISLVQEIKFEADAISGVPAITMKVIPGNTNFSVYTNPNIFIDGKLYNLETSVLVDGNLNLYDKNKETIKIDGNKLDLVEDLYISCDVNNNSQEEMIKVNIKLYHPKLNFNDPKIKIGDKTYNLIKKQ